MFTKNSLTSTDKKLAKIGFIKDSDVSDNWVSYTRKDEKHSYILTKEDKQKLLHDSYLLMMEEENKN